MLHVCTCTYYVHNIHFREHHWTQQLTPINVEFKKTPGPKVSIPGTVREIFFLFFTQTLLQLIVEQSNKYAAECMGQEKYGK